MPMIMMSGREVRRVPMDYEHPTIGEQDKRFGLRASLVHGQEDRPMSMFLKPYDDALREWLDEREAWMRGERPEWFEEREDDPYTFEEYHGCPPDPAYYLRRPLPPESDECPYGIQLWETVSEGSPISPVFEDSDAGRREMAQHMAASDTTSILSHLDVAGWYRLITGEAWGTDIHTGELV